MIQEHCSLGTGPAAFTAASLGAGATQPVTSWGGERDCMLSAELTNTCESPTILQPSHQEILMMMMMMTMTMTLLYPLVRPGETGWIRDSIH